ncbi:Ger(x)C family spore germination protein [Clostridium sp. Mt-5]|uniref:Ger(X)C family spore germination protein n=1 Tax=Clostridium moutaii TaxID=3240932 RepID=A0ABV4BU85_9CLOT
MNKSIHKPIIIVTFIITAMIFSGCWDQHPFERIGFITLLGIEESKDISGMKITTISPVTDPETKSRSEILTTTSSLIRSSREELRRKSSKSMEAGKTQVVLYSKEIAEKEKIYKINEILERDPTDSIIAWLIVVDGSTEGFLREIEKLSDKQRPSIYLTQLLERNTQSGYTPETRVNKFDTISFREGVDNIAPLVKMEKDGVVIEGTALFSKDKMVGSLTPKNTSLLMTMMGSLKHTEYQFNSLYLSENDLRSKHGISIGFNKCKRKIKVKIIDNRPVVDISLKLSASIDEYETDNLDESGNLENLNLKMQEELNKDCRNVINYLQEINSDPIGIGNIVRAKYNSYWKKNDWSRVYRDSVINVDVQLETTQYGVLQ